MVETVLERAQQLAFSETTPWDLDEPHAAMWQALRNFFPSHAIPTQTDCGYMMVSWKLHDSFPSSSWAAPIMIRIRPGLLLALWTCDPEARIDIACAEAESVHEALYDYDPHSRVSTCDVIELGDG